MWPPLPQLMGTYPIYNLSSITPPQPETRGRKLVQPTSTLGNSLNDRAITRIPKKMGVGAMIAVVVGYVFSQEPYVAYPVALGVGYPLGVYLADRKESSFWITFIGTYLGWKMAAPLLDSPNPSELSEWTAWTTLLGMPVLASELSRLGPKPFRKPPQARRVSFALAPTLNGGLSAAATLRF